MTSTFSGSEIVSMVPCTTSITPANLLCATSLRALCAMSVASTAYTLRAPAMAAKIARMPEPVPTSRITFPWNWRRFCRIAL